MPAKIYQRLLQIGLVASFVIVLFRFRDLLFPYITSKQLPFNILIEVLFVFWLVLVLRYPAYRPKKSLITYGLLAYFAAILVSCFVGVNFTLSFWGNAERMLGFFPLLHFLVFYLILITVIRGWEWWEIVFGTSVLFAVVISFIGLFGPETYSRIGNTAYVSGYLIFNIFFCFILFLRHRSNWRWLYLLPIIPMFLEFWACRTSGAIIGLFTSILLMLLLFGFFHQEKKNRGISLGVFFALIIATVFLFSQHNAKWFQDSFLYKLTTQKNTFQTRLISWRGAVADFPNHPVFGTGFGNYAVIFDKHFDPKFFNYATTETYFDRAHNNILDILSTTGAVGLLAYLSIFLATIYYLWGIFKANGRRVSWAGDEGSRRNLEIIIIVSLLAAYFIQNLAVFDSFVTYIGLMLILAYIYWLVREAAGDTEVDEDSGVRYSLVIKKGGKELVILLVLLIAAYILSYQANIKPWRVFKGTIDGYGQIVSGQYEKGIDSYRQALVGTPFDHDGRVTLINLVSANPAFLSRLPAEKIQSTLDYVVDLAKKNVNMNPQDSLMQMQLAQVLDIAARYNYENLAAFNYYSSQAREAIEKSIDASPGRIPVYLIKARMQLIVDQKEEAAKTLEYAVSLNSNYYHSYCNLALLYLYIKDDKKTEEPLNKCLDMGKGDTSDFSSAAMLEAAIDYKIKHQDYERALLIAGSLANEYGTSGEVWFNLAKLYFLAGDQQQGELAAKQAAALDPQFTKQWSDFVKSQKGAAGNQTKKK